MPSTAVSQCNISSDLRAVMAELSCEFLERSDELEMLAISALAGQHMFLLGPPGSGKTKMVNAFCARTGLSFWSIQMDRQLGKEESFGPVDIALYEQTGVWQRDVSGTLAEAEIALIDEVGKAGPASLNLYLQVFNERTFLNGKTMLKLPIISVVGSSNEYLEDELAAMWDRFLVRMRVDYIIEPANFMSMLRGAIRGPQTGSAQTTIDHDAFLHAVEHDVPAVVVPDTVLQALVGLRDDLRAEQIVASDRRWAQAISLLQASAYLRGNSTVDEDDLVVLQHVLWQLEAEKAVVTRLVLARTSPIIRDALDLQQQIDEITEGILERRGQASSVRSNYGGEANVKAVAIDNRVDELRELAQADGRSTTRLDALSEAVLQLRVMILVECLNVPADRAEKKVRQRR